MLDKKILQNGRPLWSEVVAKETSKTRVAETVADMTESGSGVTTKVAGPVHIHHYSRKTFTN